MNRFFLIISSLCERSGARKGLWVSFCFITILLFINFNPLVAQTTLGVKGLLNSPTAQFSPEGTVKIGGNFLNTNMTPDKWDYNTFNFFLNITFFSFFEAAINNTAFDLHDRGKFDNVDRSVSVRVRALKEGRYHPAIAIGSNDLLTSNKTSLFSGSGGNKYFGSHYVALSKNLSAGPFNLGFHTAYNVLSSRHKTLDNPISGGISISPKALSTSRCFSDLSFIAEYDTRNVNLGSNMMIFRHLYFQIFIQDFKYICFGAHAQFNIF